MSDQKETKNYDCFQFDDYYEGKKNAFAKFHWTVVTSYK